MDFREFLNSLHIRFDEDPHKAGIDVILELAQESMQSCCIFVWDFMGGIPMGLVTEMPIHTAGILVTGLKYTIGRNINEDLNVYPVNARIICDTPDGNKLTLTDLDVSSRHWDFGIIPIGALKHKALKIVLEFSTMISGVAITFEVNNGYISKEKEQELLSYPEIIDPPWKYVNGSVIKN